jgi:thymidylate kinase
MLITFSGLDGSGKSTLAQRLNLFLKEQGYRPKLLHMIKWTLVNRIGELFVKQNKEGQKKVLLRQHIIFRWLRIAVMILDVMRFWLFLLLVKSCKKILICDRYFYDLGVQGIYSEDTRVNFVKRYWRLVPRPTISFFLEVAPRDAMNREGEHRTEYYENKNSLYYDMVKDIPGIKVIPAESLKVMEMLIVYYANESLHRTR